ncbi:MAG: hypothetical protein ACRYG7_10050 [Janthinobacterium lividum]
MNGNADNCSSDNAGTNVVRLTSVIAVKSAPQLSPTRELERFQAQGTDRSDGL